MLPVEVTVTAPLDPTYEIEEALIPPAKSPAVVMLPVEVTVTAPLDPTYEVEEALIPLA